MNSAPTLEIKRKTPAASAATQVVFALNPMERSLFLRDDPSGLSMDVPQTWIDTEGHSQGSWEKLLREMRPTVLVTAWNSLPIPESWGLEADCPLRYLCSITGTVRNKIPRSLVQKGILVSNWGSVISHTIAEHALLLTMASLRTLNHWPDYVTVQHSHLEMMKSLKTRCLRGKRVGLHGFGAIAREIVAMLKPHQVEISAYSEGVPLSLYQAHGVNACRNLQELFSTSEILIECEGLNERSRGSVSAEILELLPLDAVFVNVGRGLVADEAALAKMAARRRLRVALDVFHQEPLPTDSPLLGNPGVILSPHAAGPTWDTYPLCGWLALKNVEAFLRGETPEHLMSLEAYDRTT